MGVANSKSGFLLEKMKREKKKKKEEKEKKEEKRK